MVTSFLPNGIVYGAELMESIQRMNVSRSLGQLNNINPTPAIPSKNFFS